MNQYKMKHMPNYCNVMLLTVPKPINKALCSSKHMAFHTLMLEGYKRWSLEHREFHVNRRIKSKLFFSYCCISGDARNDSPGFSAKYCTYTMLDEADDSILRMGFKDKRECGGKSPNMETDAFVEALDDLQRKLKVVEVCTDSSSSITKKMSK